MFCVGRMNFSSSKFSPFSLSIYPDTTIAYHSGSDRKNFAKFWQNVRNGMTWRELQKKFFVHYKSPLVKKLSQNLP